MVYLWNEVRKSGQYPPMGILVAISFQYTRNFILLNDRPGSLWRVIYNQGVVVWRSNQILSRLYVLDKLLHKFNFGILWCTGIL